MVTRAIIDTSGIKVSKPGVDVTSATLDQLLLTINARMGQLLFAGYISGTSGTVSYGSTYPSRPDALAQIVWIAGVFGSTTFISPTSFYSGPPTVVNSDFWMPNPLMQISIGLSSTTFTASTSVGGLIQGIRYVIFRKPMAA